VVLLSLFGRARSLERVNSALRGAMLQPEGFQEAVRLALVRLAKDSLGLPQRGEPREAERGELDAALARAARLFAYCFLGSRDWQDRFTDAAEQERLLALAEAGPEGLEGRVISLALLSGYAHESLSQRFETVAVAEEGDEPPG
jgi:hypothetical protein